MMQCHIQMHFLLPGGHDFQENKNISKVYVSIEDFAIRRLYVDPERQLFMFNQPILGPEIQYSNLVRAFILIFII